MARSIFLLSFNINGTKDKASLIDEFINDYHIVCLQEHLLSSTSSSFLQRSTSHQLFLINARTNFNRPSGGLACFVKRSLSGLNPTCLCSNDHFLAIQLGNTVIINTYLPHNACGIDSMTRFAKACSSLCSGVKQFADSKLTYLIVGDLNCNNLDSSAGTDCLLDLAPDYKIVPKDQSYTYIHHSEIVSNIDHAICSPSLRISEVHVLTDEQDIDHMPMPFTFSLSDVPVYSSIPKPSRCFDKYNWNRANLALYSVTLATLLSSIRIPFHLLQTQVPRKNVVADINLYYSQIISCLKNAESCAVPYERVWLGTCQPVWNNDSELNSIKNRANLLLRI